MRILIYRGLNNSYYIVSEENAHKIPKEILNEIPKEKDKFNGDTEVLFSRGSHPEVEQIKNKITKSELLNNLEEKGFLKVIL
ncbi:hypothetical protein OHV63_08700 [Acinetobacter baumannii]|uniref:hypothetical protein n=1 Tax=Acinetobacter baumannii TaxID=470 RepID=UPI0008109129|nr:hypothetical protein [Acinetobacter baumannii]MDC4612103.1 hypothetical protein [Acinetobacter baumannii]MDC5015868.1 hypothetical protein [Acinetobacter baumannii]MDV7389196.1 hypothetical protein [Acinetobacter baumannii]WFF52753.1 hypothetical protein OSV61_13035 [Acinetobacter baumannii]